MRRRGHAVHRRALLLLSIVWLLGGCHRRTVLVAPQAPAADPAPPPESRAEKPAPPPEEPAAPPVAEPSNPQLLPGEQAPDTLAIRDRLARTQGLLSLIAQRSLTEAQREQADAARAFVGQAAEALDGGESQRALVLADKGLILAEDVESSTRE